jgi:hypothetical protein
MDRSWAMGVRAAMRKERGYPAGHPRSFDSRAAAQQGELLAVMQV